MQHARASRLRSAYKITLWLIALLALPILVALLLLRDTKPDLRFELVAFEDLPGWSDVAAAQGLPALVKSCEKILSLPAGRSLPGADIGGTYADWQGACNAILTTENVGAVLRNHFQPLEVSMGGETEGVFTGYYEALLKGSYEKTDRYYVPLYTRPPELVMVDLGRFRSDLAGRRIAGSVQNGRLVPFGSRADIEEGRLEGRGLEALYVDSPVDAYFLHVQGSGRVQMPDGSLIGVGYAAQNGHANRLIGRRLIEMGAIPAAEMSGQAIREWLADNPCEMMNVIKTDPSYVFFRELENGDGPYGSANVVLTPGHSLAVDRKFLPLHAPVWLSASHPDPSNKENNEVPFNRLMVAQDTGGAINGEIRGDVFWGFGDAPEEIAGRMANKGRYWLLLPKKLALRAADQTGG